MQCGVKPFYATMESMELKLDRPQVESITTVLYKQLKRNLIIGRLKPGDSLTLKSLTDSLGVSQTPVREALLRLVSERLLESVHGRSIKVPVLTPEAFTELREIRIQLETMAMERAVPNITAAVLRTLEDIQREYMVHRETEDYAGILSTNIDFHFTMYRAAGMPNLLAMIENLWAQTGPYGGFMYKTPTTQHPDGHPHDHILDALKRRDTQAAVAHVRTDVERHGKRMLEYLRSQGHFESPGFSHFSDAVVA
ncbi:MAG: putative GntR-family transcriptional regulator [Paucimonas sp.]|nr:putative GntR-family transcriptional regulator [Paucimonas sp.]